MRQFMDKIIEAVKDFEERNPGIYVERINFDNGRNLAMRGDGKLYRIGYDFDIDLTGTPTNYKPTFKP